jgi:hypothetical protein
MNQLYHFLPKIFTKIKYNEFVKESLELKKNQLNIIAMPYEHFIKKFAVTNYQDWEGKIDEIRKRNTTKCVPTSGSTNKIKWIPYTKKFKNELWNASAPWIYDLYLKYPEIKKGKHFWSLSWLPNELRSNQGTNDLDVFSIFEQIILSPIMTKNSIIQNSPTLEIAMEETAYLLLSENISLISVWSPTFLLELLELFIVKKDIFLKKLTEEKQKILKNHSIITPDFCSEFFKDLKLISCWDSGASEIFADKLKYLFPKVAFQGKGLWATEGVISIPFENKKVLSYLSHFYEFECLESKKIFPSWDLEIGKNYSVIITTGSDLIRYRMNDIVKVEGFYNTVPCVKFLGREKEIDLVGEKLSHEILANILIQTCKKFNFNAYFFIAHTIPSPYYELFFEKNDKFDAIQVENYVEELLLEHYHYKLARELRQLHKLKVTYTDEPNQTYVKFASQKIEIRGNIKVEPVILV